ncbi:MAG: DUF4384 domain-containing protein [Acidobacteria bacterium]|nr:DUF4384 domain-containing protein [Acidobacteriota bacterium]
MDAKVRVFGRQCLLMASALLYCHGGALAGRPLGLALSRPMAQTGATLKAEEFIKSRPGGTRPHPGRYRARQDFPQGRAYVALGVTIGRGRRATEAELRDRRVAKVRLGSGDDYVLERISDTTAVTDGTLIQMIIEYLAYPDATGSKVTDQVGYLYVINREQYSNGKYGSPKLIFPTRRTYVGDSRVLPGKTVTLPVPDRAWKVSRSASATAQAFETYTIIVSPTPLKDASGLELQRNNLGAGSITLDETLVAEWMRRWGGDEWRAELEDGAGQLITQREQIASGDPGRGERSTDEESSDLTKEDAPPQIVYRRALSPGGTMLVTVKLPFKDAAATTKPGQ